MKLPATSALLLASLLFAGSAPADKPNILFVMSDDLSYALSGMGHPECQTPKLDAFAQSAVSFTRAYCQLPLCEPSRASIMSGPYPKVNGVTGNGGAVDSERVTLPNIFRIMATGRGASARSSYIYSTFSAFLIESDLACTPLI